MKTIIGAFLALFLFAAPAWAVSVQEHYDSAPIGTGAAEVHADSIEFVFAFLTPVFGPPPAAFMEKTDQIIAIMVPDMDGFRGFLSFVDGEGEVFANLPVPLPIFGALLQALSEREGIDDPITVGKGQVGTES